ncbi:hypothetical protein Halru_2877 [Halovivax ruber XH-70]|uniref:DUF4350 domain-containing protein n=2 Tax=Halovivax ruber TaxID=387341 RepID=L0IHJ4_HALRX|nr:hypothetical protein Halru_2877 [Halovivax ruber XH-70]
MAALDLDAVPWSQVLLAALLGATVLTIVIAGATSASAFGLFNPTWDGSSEFRGAIEADADTELVVARETAVYESGDPTQSVAFVTAPADAYDSTDASRVRQFVRNGGTLVVLENFGSAGNDLLASVGAEARVDGRLLRDEHQYDRGPAMPIATDVNTSTLDRPVDRLVFNHATAVNASDDATILGRTSPYATLGPADTNRSAADFGRYPVAVSEPVGNGTVVTIGDPSLTINAMFDRANNEAFLAALSESADRVIVDVSHSEELPPAHVALLAVRNSSPLAAAIGGVGIAVIGLVAGRWPHRLVARFRGRPGRSAGDPTARSQADVDALRSHLRERHPEWDSERIQRIITALNTGQTEGRSNE